MTREERVLRDLCIEIAHDRIGGERFNSLLIESGIYLDELEWDAANRILASPLSDWVEDQTPPC